MKKATFSILFGLIIIISLVFSNTIVVQADTSINDMDFDNNGIIDIIDLANIANDYNRISSNDKWNSKYDLNGDEIVDIYDIVKISKAIGTEVLSDNTIITNKFIDENFKNEVYLKLGKTSPAPILYSDVKIIEELDVGKKNISNMSGIEYFTSLNLLTCDNNQLQTLDVSKNTALTLLYCNNNKLTTLDVSKNTILNYLYCSYNQLQTLDVSENTALISLYCVNNQLKMLDISKNLELIELDCGNNGLTTLDVSKNIKLEYFYCAYNELKTIYSSVEKWLMGIYKTQYTDANRTVTNEDLVIQLDITSKFIDENFRNAVCNTMGKSTTDLIFSSDVEGIQELDVSRRDISNMSGIEYFTSLANLNCHYNQLTTLDVSKNTALIELNCGENQLTTLDVSKNIALTSFDCSTNKLETLDVNNNTELYAFLCGNNKLTTLDVRKNIKLIYLHCSYNELKTLYASVGQWGNNGYQTQYTDSTRTDMTNNLTVTII